MSNPKGIENPKELENLETAIEAKNRSNNKCNRKTRN